MKVEHDSEQWQPTTTFFVLANVSLALKMCCKTNMVVWNSVSFKTEDYANVLACEADLISCFSLDVNTKTRQKLHVDTKRTVH